MAIGAVLQGVIAVIQVLPMLLNTIRVMTTQLEEDSPEGGGLAQKDVILGMLRAVLDTSDKFAQDGEMLSPVVKDAIMQVAGTTVDLVVGLYNTIGTFKKSS